MANECFLQPSPEAAMLSQPSAETCPPPLTYTFSWHRASIRICPEVTSWTLPNDNQPNSLWQKQQVWTSYAPLFSKNSYISTAV